LCLTGQLIDDEADLGLITSEQPHEFITRSLVKLAALLKYQESMYLEESFTDLAVTAIQKYGRFTSANSLISFPVKFGDFRSRRGGTAAPAVLFQDMELLGLVRRAEATTSFLRYIRIQNSFKNSYENSLNLNPASIERQTRE
jgi:hypothetical protein